MSGTARVLEGPSPFFRTPLGVLFASAPCVVSILLFTLAVTDDRPMLIAFGAVALAGMPLILVVAFVRPQILHEAIGGGPVFSREVLDHGEHAHVAAAATFGSGRTQSEGYAVVTDRRLIFIPFRLFAGGRPVSVRLDFETVAVRRPRFHYWSLQRVEALEVTSGGRTFAVWSAHLDDLAREMPLANASLPQAAPASP